MWAAICGIGIAVVCVGVIVGFVFLIIWLQEKLRHRRKSEIYWDKKLGQILTKDGECLYDEHAMLKIGLQADERVNNSFKIYEDKFAKLQAQLQCSAKTQGRHKMVFEKKDTATGLITFGMGVAQMRFFFKCSICGLEITKTEKELSAIEKEALKKLKLL